MPTTIPALRGKFGSTEYWLTTMRAGELVTKILMPTDMPQWEDLTIEEKFQRDVKLARVIKDIAPYFASDPSRFSGALVLAIINPDNISFETLGEFGGGSRVPQLYQSASRDMGFLTLNGEEMLVPIDGQHRAKAFKFAMNGTDDNGRPIPSIKSNTALAEDLAPVILIRFNPLEVRRIFNKINRYAKATTKSENVVTDDDDAIAVLTRQLIGATGVLPARLVRIGANTLPANAPEFTTLTTLYEANREIALGLDMPGAGKMEDMDDEQRDLARDEIRGVWELLLQHIGLFEKALADPTMHGDRTRMNIREEMLLGKPIGQLALVRAFMEMREKCSGVSEASLCDRLNRIDWGIDAGLWKGVLVAPNGRVLSGKTTVNRAAAFISHLGGVRLSANERGALLEAVHGADWQTHELPAPVA